MATKRCNVCGLDQPIEQFYRAPGCVDGRRGDCRTCFQAKARARKDANPELKETARLRTRRWIEDNRDRYVDYKAAYRQTENYKRALRKAHLKAKYGLTLEQYDDMLDRQGGGCAICDEPPGDTALHVDHCHDTGRIRGLLCFRCNSALGNLRHDPEVIERALQYVAVHWRVERLKGGVGLTR